MSAINRRLLLAAGLALGTALASPAFASDNKVTAVEVMKVEIDGLIEAGQLDLPKVGLSHRLIPEPGEVAFLERLAGFGG